MDIKRIVSNLRAERDRLSKAIAAIEALGSGSSAVAGRRRAAGRTAPSQAPRRGRRRMSAAARKKLSELLKARWASGKMGRAKRK